MKPQLSKILRLATPTALLLLLTACASLPTHSHLDFEQLQGRWEGKGPGGSSSVTITGDTLHFHAREDFWYETQFTLPPVDGPKQLHATILKDGSGRTKDIGTLVVTIYKFESLDGTPEPSGIDELTLAVVEDFKEPPSEPVVGDWEWVADIFELKRVSTE